MNAWMRPSFSRCSSSSSAPKSPSSLSSMRWSASGSLASIVDNRDCRASMSNRSVDRKSSSRSAKRVRAHDCANSKRCVTSCRATNVRKSVASSDQSASNRRTLGTTNITAPGPDRGTATSNCPSTRCARNPSTCPTWAPISNGEICASMPLIACISGGRASRCVRSIDSPMRLAAGSRRPARFSVFAPIHSARRTARTSATSMGGSRPVNRATWSSATRTASSKPWRSSSVASRSSPASAALATAT